MRAIAIGSMGQAQVLNSERGRTAEADSVRRKLSLVGVMPVAQVEVPEIDGARRDWLRQRAFQKQRQIARRTGRPGALQYTESSSEFEVLAGHLGRYLNIYV